MPHKEDKEQYEFAKGKFFIKAIRSSGYKNAATALGELVDNSIQAGAENVEILVSEHQVKISQRTVHRIHEIAVLDDGEGMSPELLRRALKLGDGTKFDEKNGMGKFGVGLPQASVSQAKRVDVWSWQGSMKKARHTYVDLSDSAWVDKMVIPEPDQDPIPKKWTDAAKFNQKSGTLIVWSKVDRCNWNKAKTLYQHSEFLIGRMYRNWLSKQTKTYSNVKIRLVAWDEDANQVRDEWEFEPNDPLYLMPDTSVKAVLPKGTPNPPFEAYGSPIVKKYRVQPPDGATTDETVTMTFSKALPETREVVEGRDAGHLPHGKHARRNIGLSIVREGRELELDSNWADRDPRNRWWGAQVEFGRGMDDIFGVTNNKQHADRLSSMVDKKWDDFALNEGETEQQIRDRLQEEDFSTFVCLDIAMTVRKHTDLIMGQVEKDKPAKKKTRHATDSPEKKGTEATKARKEETGIPGSSDEEEKLSNDEKKKRIAERMAAQGYEPEAIEQVKGDVVDHGLKFSFTQRPLGDDAFFSIESQAGAIIVALNTDHVAYEKLFSTLDGEDSDTLEKEALVERVRRANDALKLLLEAWGRLEDEATGTKKFVYKDARADWGRIARQFLTYGEETE